MIAQGLLAPAGGLPATSGRPGWGSVPPRRQSRVRVKLPALHSSATKTPIPVATAMTAAMGLRGFRLNLAVGSRLQLERLGIGPPRSKALGEEA